MVGTSVPFQIRKMNFVRPEGYSVPGSLGLYDFTWVHRVRDGRRHLVKPFAVAHKYAVCGAASFAVLVNTLIIFPVPRNNVSISLACIHTLPGFSRAARASFRALETRNYGRSFLRTALTIDRRRSYTAD